MTAKFRHIAIMCQNAPRVRAFYENLFNMRRPGSETNPAEAHEFAKAFGYPVLASKHVVKPFNSTVWGIDGNIGVAFLRRQPGYPGGIDHFGFEVEDIEAVADRLNAKYPKVGITKRPVSRTFAAYSTHDPEGNFFDLAQPGQGKRYQKNWADNGWTQERYISHFTIRAMDPAALANFYVDVYGLEEQSKALEDPNFYVSDGTVSLVIVPWKIEDYRETEHRGPGLDHIGFKVENVEAFKKDVETMRTLDPEWLSPESPSIVPEYNVVLRMLATCRHGRHQLPDPEGNFIDVAE